MNVQLSFYAQVDMVRTKLSPIPLPFRNRHIGLQRYVLYTGGCCITRKSPGLRCWVGVARAILPASYPQP